ncbi:sigma-54 interaction domain-containing protein [Aidingimonas lacisalsi]|uniref:sigma-54 interaction domain-containing protein n=1 Tax=Aidingimonas lacisalsi TaxID=2604086 RepID=UPI001F349277|nr:sigma-54 dependent transcriptional regulator [Aidingimonas lacisalsi]
MHALKRLLYVGNRIEANRLILVDTALKLFEVSHYPRITMPSDRLIANHFDIGIIDMGSLCESGYRDIEELIDASCIEWIALIDNDYLRNENNRLIIKTLFYAYHILPGNGKALCVLLNHAASMKRTARSASSTRVLHYLQHAAPPFYGSAPSMRRVLQSIHKVAIIHAPVMIIGESGTGKELVARTIHAMSARADKPFITINCGALPAQLIQAELFGHEKGAFTDAHCRRIGRLESADGGTLFLDEIGDLPRDLQVNLLRFLEDHRIRRLGSVQEVMVDTRIISATHVDLLTAIKAHRFREDLYHRLNVIQLDIPPLRERREDLETMAQGFFREFSPEKAAGVHGFSENALEAIAQHDWPGNVRELINRIRRAMVMCEHHLIEPEDLGLEGRLIEGKPIAATLEAARDNAEIAVVEAALQRHNYKIVPTARELGISRITLYRLLEKHRIEWHRKTLNGVTVFPLSPLKDSSSRKH